MHIIQRRIFHQLLHAANPSLFFTNKKNTLGIENDCDIFINHLIKF